MGEKVTARGGVTKDESMSDQTAIVALVEEPGTRAEEVPADDSNDPKIGRWYWVADPEGKWLGCVTRVGSNFAEVSNHWDSSVRIHFDEFWSLCTYEANPDEYIDQRIAHHRAKVSALMEEVRAITSRLSITTAAALPGATETQALALRNEQAMDGYKSALVKAKETDLPELFKNIEKASTALGSWMKAKLIPLKAEAEAMKPAIKAVEQRIFSVELYAGLCEEVVQIRKGEPAAVGEKIHLMQRRAYMDEECLARYTKGGMKFKDLAAFDRWMAKKENFERLLPFQRGIIAFRIRRREAEVEIHSLRQYIEFMFDDREADKATFLYLRNGEQLFRLKTGIEFDAKLFPDMDRQSLSGKLWARMFAGRVDKVITDDQLRGIIEEEDQREREDEKRAKADPGFRSFGRSYRESESYVHFSPESVYYDDIARFVQKEINKHNRLVLVLQGLLDRSPVFMPHPPWSLWANDGFSQALELVYDSSRALSSGAPPDFEAYRSRLNASLKTGSITIGQEDAWLIHEGSKENDRRDRDYRNRSSDFRPKRHKPYGNPGPGCLARVSKYAPRAKTCTFEWTRTRQTRDYYNEKPEGIRTTFTVATSQVLNVDAYTAGDFKLFFDDPRTRADYLRWAPLLLEAEEYLAGNRKLGTETE
jgi:hypothetical protein